MSRDINPFGLRMPVELRARVEAAAKANGRSLNSEIVARLQDSFGSSLMEHEDDFLEKSKLQDYVREYVKTEFQSMMTVLEMKMNAIASTVNEKKGYTHPGHGR